MQFRLSTHPRAQARTVNIYNWSDYVEPTVIEAFTKETGIKVKYDTFDANDTLETKLLAGKSGYDVVVPTAYFLERQIKAGVFQKLDKSKLPNLVNVWPEIAQRGWPATIPAINTPSITCGAPPASATTSRRRARSSSRTGRSRRRSTAGTSCSSRRVSRASRTAASTCSIPSDDIMPAALHYLGLDPNSKDGNELDAAANLLTKLRPFVRKFHSSEYLNALASGEICLVVGWSGDIKQAQKRAAEAKNGVEIGYAIPKGGAQMWFDNLAIPKDAKHVAEAHAFIDYHAAAGGGGEEQQSGRLRQRQSGEPAVDRQGGARRPHRLSRCGHHGEALHHRGARPEDAARCSTGCGPRSRPDVRWIVAPAPVQPEPLLGMLAHPAFDHIGDGLHGAGDVDLAVGVARPEGRLR